jgi:hypothetical protein
MAAANSHDVPSEKPDAPAASSHDVPPPEKPDVQEEKVKVPEKPHAKGETIEKSEYDFDAVGAQVSVTSDAPGGPAEPDSPETSKINAEFEKFWEATWGSKDGGPSMPRRSRSRSSASRSIRRCR